MLNLSESITLAAKGKVSDISNPSNYIDQIPWPVDFIEMVVPTPAANTNPSPDADGNVVQRLTSHFHDISAIGAYSGDTVVFTAVGHLLGFSTVSDDLEVKDSSMDISLSGVGQELTSLILGSAIEGSRFYVLRSFYDQHRGTLVDTPYQRWAGRVNNYSIQDDYRFSDEDKIVITVSCRSLLTTLLERVTGRYTNRAGFEQYAGEYRTNLAVDTDRSMEYVASLVNFAPNFGEED